MPAEYARYAVVVLASETSWVEVRDASGKALLSRRLEPGQPAGINGQYPMSVIVGNAHATQLWSKGHAVDLKAAARENVARIELR